MAGTILLVVVCSACRTTQKMLVEEADSTVQHTAVSSATSLATDKFLQSVVLKIDSIVYTTLPAPQWTPPPEDARITGKDGARRGASNGGATSPTKGSAPLSHGARVIIGGIRLESNTADSSSVYTAKADSSTLHSRNSSNVVSKKEKAPSFKWCLSLTAIAAILMAAIAWRVRKRKPS